MTNFWHDLEPGPNVPDVIQTVVEIPKGSRNKYEFDKRIGAFKLDRVLYSAVQYPGDYGFIPQTYYDDGDPLDVLVMTNLPTFTGCLVEARPVGVFKMLDKGEPDDKILAVLQYDPFFADYTDFKQLPAHYLKEVEHFFTVYKDLEGTRVEPVGWEDAAYAKTKILYSINAYWDMRAGRTLNRKA
jgi:inorganic pyrophosphatase